MGFPSLDAADLMINLREKYNFLELNFIENYSPLFSNNTEYNERYQFLVHQADNRISLKQTQELIPKCAKYFDFPQHYFYALNIANRLLINKVSPLLSRLAKIAIKHQKNVDTFKLNTFLH